MIRKVKSVRFKRVLSMLICIAMLVSMTVQPVSADTENVLYEEFNAIGLPTGWSQLSGPNDLEQYYNWECSGGYAYSYAYGDYEYDPDEYLISKQIAVYGNVTLEYSALQGDSGYSDYVEVYVSTAGNSSVSDFHAVSGSGWYVSSSAPTIKTVDLSAYAGQNIYVALRHYNSYDGVLLKIDYMKVTCSTSSATALNAPVLSTSGISRTDNSVTLAVPTASIQDASAAIEYRRSSDNATWGSWQSSNVFSSLNSGSTYYFQARYVPSDASSFLVSDESNTVSASTMQAPTVTTVLNEQFSTDGSVPPSGWSQIRGSGSGNWSVEGGFAKSFAFNASTWTWFDPDQYLVSPQISVNGETTLTYAAKQYDSSRSDTIGVFVSSQGNSNAGSFALVPGSSWEVSSDVPTVKTVDLSAYAGMDIYVSIRHYDSGEGEAVGIDYATVTCTSYPETTQLSAPALNASQVTLDSNTLTIAAPSAPSADPDATVQYRMSSDGTVWGNWQLSNVFTGISTGETYYFQARFAPSVPEDYSLSNASSAISFTCEAQHNVNIASLIGGSISTSNVNASAGSTVTGTVSATTGYVYTANSLVYYLESDTSHASPVSITPDENGAFSFVMPAESIELSAAFTALSSYNITVDGDIIGGTISAEASALAGSTVTVTVTPDSGSSLVANSLTYTAEGGSPVVISGNTFTMPSANVTLTAQFGWNGSAAASVTPVGDVYKIYSAAELKWVADQVNSGNNFDGKTIELQNDIDLNNTAWVPMGGMYAGGYNAYSASFYINGGNYFSGVFDGKNHTVSGININYTTSGKWGVGFFGYVLGGTVKNLSTQGTLTAGNYNSAVGGIVGFFTADDNSGEQGVFNCHNGVTITGATSALTPYRYVGGVVGGGIAQANCKLNINNCSNSAEINASGRSGGIAGGIASTTQYAASVDGCYNSGAVRLPFGTGKCFSGGIVGYAAGSISNCINEADIYMTAGDCRYQGGIVGIIYGFGSGYPDGRLYNCLSVTDITNGESWEDCPVYSSADGSNDTPLFNCYWDSSVTSLPQTFNEGGTNVNVMGQTTAELQTASFTDNFAYDGVNYFVPKANDYPQLYWQAGLSEPLVKYSVNIASLIGGSISTSNVNASAGSTVTGTVSASTGHVYTANSLVYYLESDTSHASPVSITPDENGAFSFVMPAESIELSAAFTALSSYNITVDGDIIGGTISAEASAFAGSTVTVTVTPDSGNGLVANSLTYTAEGGSPVVISGNTFTMPSANVTLTAQFEWNGSAAADVTPVGDVYKIYNAAELKWVADQVNSGNNFDGKTIELQNDIDLNNTAWVPMGGMYAGGYNSYSAAFYINGGNYFSGVFDGKNHTVSGININYTTSNKWGIGFFGYVLGGTVKNLSTQGTLTAGNYNNAVGGIVGFFTADDNSGEQGVFNCHNGVTITGATSALTPYRYVGGVVGGGIAQANCKLNINNCSNSAEINASGRSGGIAGGIASTTQYAASVDGCYNSGAVRLPFSEGKCFSGGIVGYAAGSISNCINEADIYMTAGDCRYQGGIVGIIYGYGSGYPDGRLYNCLSVTDITNGESGDDCPVYSSADRSNDTPVFNCYWDSSVTSLPQTFGQGGTNVNVMGKATSELQTASFTDNFTYDGVNYFVPKANDYPQLYWQAGLSEPVAHYTVASAAMTNGTVTFSSASPEAGDTITVTATPDEGYQLVSGSLTYNGTEITENEGVYSFTMPAEAVIIAAQFELIPVYHDVTVENTVSSAAIVSIESGSFVEGEITFTVACDEACVVFYSTDNGVTYTMLSGMATENAGIYSYVTNVNSAKDIKVVLKGDFDMDGHVGISDAGMLLTARKNALAFTGIAAMMQDIDGNGNLNILDADKILKASYGMEMISW